jgi:ABC-type nitrate/sulfonate/bicarbonate transport system substrate-binding protein
LLKTLSVRDAVAVLLVLASVALVTPARAADPPSLTHVTLVQPASCLCGAPYYAAQELGYFKDEGLDVDITTVLGTGAVYTALQEGSAQFGVTNGPSLLTAVRRGVKQVAFVAIDRGLSNYNMVVSETYARAHGVGTNEDYRTAFPKLREARIAVLNSKSTSALMLKSLQKQLRLDGEGFNLVGLTEDVAPASLQRGDIDASWYAIPPAGGVLVFRSSIIPEFNTVIGDVVIATSDYISKSSDVVSKMARAIARGSNALLDPKTQARALEATYELFPQIPRATIASEILKPGVPVANGVMEPQTWTLTNALDVQMGLLDGLLAPEQLVGAFTLRFIPTSRVAP